jgi:GTP-binding protein EngB required for normal cell division
MDVRAQQLADEVLRQLKESIAKPLVISVMGQTGVGKSSLINALFNTKLKTDPVRPCTDKIERVVVKGSSGHELWFYDLPGIGESEGTDETYLAMYRQLLVQSDVVIWAIHADNRSVSFDLEALNKLLSGLSTISQSEILSKITFVLTKIDLLTPPPWILGKIDPYYGVFAPGRETSSLLEQKEIYYRDRFLTPYKHLLVSQTYNDCHFSVEDISALSFDDNFVYYKGIMTNTALHNLKSRFPKYSAVFDRLFDNHRIVPCSSLFRYNLAQLMVVIITKLGHEAIGRFDNFASQSVMSKVPLSEAKTYNNIVIYDLARDRLLFDLTQARI